MIKAEHLVKVFGPDPKKAMALLSEGCSKDEILAKTHSTVAVRGINFEIRRGELFVIMGLSGSGKSTVIRLLNRLIEPTSGAVWVSGKNVHTLTPRELRELRNRRISMVFQHFAIFPHRTVRENASYGLHLRGLDGQELQPRVDWALESVGLGGWDDAYPGELSGGMKQRVGLARALATDAEVMLMDEPFSALDPLIRREMQDLLIRLHREVGRTIVFVTHDLNEAMRIGDRIMLMRDGDVVQLGTGSEILAAPSDEYVLRFVADVDRTRILIARDLMQRSPQIASLDDDPRDVLRQIELSDMSPIYVLDNGRIVGIVSPELLAAALSAGATKFAKSMLRTDYPAVEPNTRFVDLCRLPNRNSLPLAVVDDDQRLLGVIPFSALLAAIGSDPFGSTQVKRTAI